MVKTIDRAVLEIPAHLMFKPGNGSLKPTFALGPNYKIDLVQVNNSFFAIDAAVGFEKKLAHFYIAPEVRYSYSEQMKAVYLVFNIIG